MLTLHNGNNSQTTHHWKKRSIGLFHYLVFLS